MSEARNTPESTETHPSDSVGLPPLEVDPSDVPNLADMSEIGDGNGGGEPGANALSRPTRDQGGRWLPGTPSPNPLGHPRGGGRVGALKIIDDLLDEHANQQALRAAFQRMLDDDPVLFWRVIVQPLLPRAATLQVQASDGATLAGALASVRLALGMREAEE
jgi:hypothetical protein